LNVYHYTLDLSWQMVRLICVIERFDSSWPSVQKQEAALLKTLAVNLPEGDGLLNQKIEDITELRYWYESDIDTPRIIKCAAFCIDQGYQFAPSILQKQGYEWVPYISLQQSFKNPPAGITEQVIFFLTGLLNTQEHLMQIIEVHGIEQTLNPKEKQLLHIIENHPEIKTTPLSQKLGISTSTTKRMIDRLIDACLIVRQGTGRGTYYTLL
jgi:DNA-binding MarR family transcriptional regulator